MINDELKETILRNIAADRDLDRSAINPQWWDYWCLGTYTGTPTHIGVIGCTYNGYHEADYGFDQFGNVSLYAN